MTRHSPAPAMTRRAARRLRRLVEKRLAAFEALTGGAGEGASAAELERQGKALIALMKALETAAVMEDRAAAGAEGERKRRDDDEAACASLARRLEALLAPNAAPRPVGEADP